MPLTSGTRVGPYEVLTAIGAGGMGEVYRARDTKLNRDVAIKVLPDLFACDPERLARFDREAQVLASLNHPHIAHVYGIEDAGTSRAIVMEFVEGEDLTAQMARGAIPVAEALRIARQIADALEAAHERGIIHRDLKPANVKIAADGTVKVLDFGLAKAVDSSGSPLPSRLMNSPTLTSPATMAGMIVGTAAYMSPEQAKGKVADKRADVWAFGVVLHEMLTGVRLFEGETMIETMGLVATRELNLSKLPAQMPARVRELLWRCLERDPKQRLRDIGEARIVIDKALAEPADVGAVARVSEATRSSPARFVAIAAGALLLAAGAGAATWWWASSRVRELPHRRFVLPAAGLSGASRAGDIAISRDGRSIVYYAAGRLFVWDLTELRPRELKGAGETGTGEAAPAPFWSPDAQFVAYSGYGRLWRISATDGEPVAICNLPSGVVGGAWLADGTIVFDSTRGPMYQVPAAGGEAKPLIPLQQGEIDFHQPSVLPDGRGILYAVHGPSGTDTIEVFAGSVRKVVHRIPARVRASPQVFNTPVYSPTGHMLYRLDEGNVGLWAVPFSLQNLETTGEPFLVAAGARSPSVADDGTLVYAPTVATAPGQLAWVRPDGTVERAIGETRQGLASPAISPDGRRIAYAAIESNNTDIWVLDEARGQTRITATPINENAPQWMPDGRAVTFDCPTDEGAAVCAKNSDGSGETRVLIRNASDLRYAPDGRTGVYETNGTAERGLKIYDAATGQSKAYVLGTFETDPMGFSADGKYFAYASFRSGTPRIYVRQFPSGDGEWEIPELRSEFVSWPRGAGDIFALIGSAREVPVASVSIDTAGGPLFGKPRILFTLSDDRLSAFSGFAAAPDGKRFLTIQRQPSRNTVSGIVVVQNWLAEFSGSARR